MGESDEPAPALPPGGVHLSDVQRPLTLFTQGIAGRYLHLKPIEPAVKGLEGAAQPKPHRTSGEPGEREDAALYLPPSIASFDSPSHNFGAYRVAVLHQIGFIENGTYRFRLDSARQRLPALAGLPDEPPPRFGAAPRPELERFFALMPAPVLMRQVFMTLEDLRVDLAIRRDYPGARQDLERVLAQALAGRPERGAMPPFAALLEGLVQYSLGASRDELAANDPTGLLAPLLDAASAVAADEASVYDSANAALACYRLLEQAGLPRLVDETLSPNVVVMDEDEAKETQDMASLPLDEDKLRAMGVDFRGEFNAEFIDGELMDEAAGNLPQGVEIGNTGSQASQQTPNDITERRQPAQGGYGAQLREEGELAEGVRTFLYDEWNYRSQSWLKGWCRLYEYRLKGEDFGFIREVRRRHAVLAHQVRRRFQFIRPESRQRVRRVSDGEELELDSVIEAVIDRRAGYATDERVYMRRDRALRDVAAAFLLDMSASTSLAVPGDPIAEPARAAKSAKDEEDDDYPMPLWGGRDITQTYTPPAPKRCVIDVAKESLALMCDALETLGDAYAIYGFSGDGRAKVEFHVAKDFEDRLSSRTWAALAAMKPQRSTRMGPAIRHALTKLERQAARMKVLIVVSDGYPQDRDYGPDRMDDEYGIQDTAAALREAERAGVQTFCVTIDPAGYDYLRRMCEGERYMVIDEVKDLPDALHKVYRALTV